MGEINLHPTDIYVRDGLVVSKFKAAHVVFLALRTIPEHINVLSAVRCPRWLRRRQHVIETANILNICLVTTFYCKYHGFL